MTTPRGWLSTGQFCAAPNCSNSRKKTPDKSLHRFPPNDPARSKQWVINCRRADLVDKTPKYLSKNCVLCRDHFEDSQYLNPTSKRLTLVHDAVPTLFNIPDSTSTITMSKRKIIAPLVTEDPRDKEPMSTEQTSTSPPASEDPIDAEPTETPSATNVKKPARGTVCSAYGCPNETNKCPGLPFFSFPKDERRFMIWRHNIKRPDLDKLSMDKFQSLRLCAQHFEPFMFQNPADIHSGLICSATPTVLNFEITQSIPGQSYERMSENGASSTVEDRPSTELLASVDHDYAIIHGKNLPMITRNSGRTKKGSIRRTSKRQICCAIGCKNNRRDQSRYSFFQFPLDHKRCKQWVWNCRRADFDKIPPAKLNKSSYHLCQDHFEDIMFMNVKTKNSLKKLAVPTLFPGVPNPPPRATSKRRIIQRSPLPPKVKKVQASRMVSAKEELNVTKDSKPVAGERKCLVATPKILKSEPIVCNSANAPLLELDNEGDLSQFTPPEAANSESDEESRSTSDNQTTEETLSLYIQNTCVSTPGLIPLGKNACVPTLPSLTPPITSWRMDHQIAGIEASAIGLLKHAVEMDTAHRFTEALVCYQEGIQLLLDVCKATAAGTKKQHFQQRISGYMDRAEKLKAHVEEEKKSGKYHEQTHIDAGSTGHSYARVMGRFMDGAVTRVDVEDPYIRSIHQVYNFLRLCELIVKKCDNIKNIHLTTGKDEGGNGAQYQQQAARLEELSRSLHGHGVTLHVKYSQTLHDREIRLDNGWIIKIGRGLDYFKASSSKFGLGYCDYDFRPCHETTVDIFHRTTMQTMQDS